MADSIIEAVAQLLYEQEIDAVIKTAHRRWAELSPVHKAHYERRATEVAIAVVNEINAWQRSA